MIRSSFIISKILSYSPPYVLDIVTQIRIENCRGGPIVVIEELVPFWKMPSLYKMAHCYVSASHGEGWGLPLTEAMSMALPTVAVDWSGNTAFMNEENSFLVKVQGFVET